MISDPRFWTLFLVTCLVWVGLSSTADAQWSRGFFDRRALPVGTAGYSVVYRPPSAEYRFQEGGRFDLLYQTGTEKMARRTLAALRSSWPRTDSLVGYASEAFETPVVINGYNDLGNGFVEPFPFRQEIEAVSNKKPQLVARSSSWPDLVAPHELVHSAHMDVAAGVGVGGLIRLFAPDMTRALNGTAPRGLIEGVAVYRESEIEKNAGRLHAPLTTMKMRAAMLSDDPWTFTQMLEPSAYHQPFNRHYIAGGHAFKYLAERRGSLSTDFFRDAISSHNRFPFLGFGVWLTASTGEFPWQLTSKMQKRLRQAYASDLDRRRPFTSLSVVSGEKGLNHRRPYWLDEETLLAYVHGYNVLPGFYQIDVPTGERTPIRIQTLTEDRVYSLSADTTSIYASRYVEDPFVPTQRIAEVERIDLSSGAATQLTRQGRALAPVEGPSGRVHAVTNQGPFTQWSVRLDEGRLRALTPDVSTSVRQIAPAPGQGPIAALINANGDQRIYRARLRPGRRPEIEPWLGLQGRIIYDLCWGPDGRYLLFAADYPETANIFAFDTSTKQVLQLANVPFGALEPTLSPDRSTVAFVNYQHERHDLVTIPFRPDSATVVPDSVVEFGGASPRAAVPSGPDVSVGGEQSQSYSAWRHLAPRMVYPSLHPVDEDLDFTDPDEPETVGVGVSLAGSDPLKRWAYRGSAYWQDGRLWGEARVESGRFLLRPSLSVFDRTTRVSGTTPGLEERGVGLGLRLPVTLQSNVYQTLLRLGLDTEVRQIRFYGGSLSDPTAFSSRLTLSPRATVGYRLQQNRRDLVPNTGLVLGVEGEFDTWVDSGPVQIEARRAVAGGANLYLPFLRRTNTGFRLGVGILTQNEATFGTSTFVPRGYDSLLGLEEIARASGTFLRFDAEVTQPLWYIDNGLTLIPVYAKALSVYGFGQSLGRVRRGSWREVATSLGAGISLRTRLFYLFDVTFRVGTAYRVGPGDLETIYR